MASVVNLERSGSISTARCVGQQGFSRRVGTWKCKSALCDGHARLDAMARVLLDFPWQLQSVLSPYSEGYSVLHDFERLCEEERLQRVRFISEDEYCQVLERPVGAR